MRLKYAAIGMMFLFAACKHKDEVDLLNKWHLIEQLADPGDGSGTFQPVDSEKTIQFFNDGTVSSNGSLCTMNTEVGSGSTGTYNTTDSTITVDGCGNQLPYPMTYQMEGQFLILNYPCIEPCREKYEQVD
ncbi:MAG: hypothetical protein GC178_12345 [Flavobacteriales bacterium]|nr:hypothetical protein [Flavobacteriales bacterium]